MATLESIEKARRWSGFDDTEMSNPEIAQRILGLAESIDDEERDRMRKITIDPYEDMDNMGKRYPKGTLSSFRKKKSKKSKAKRKSCGCK